MIQAHIQTIGAVIFKMLHIPGGDFLMGSAENEKAAYSFEKPQHRVTLGDFYLAEYPVTQALWLAVMGGKNPSAFPGDDRPVEMVSWNDAQDFLQKLNELTRGSRPEGHLYRLPTEAQWEYAARGGPYHTDGYQYAGSDELKEVGWFEANSGSETRPVGQKYANQLGLYDMCGNVWEWCEDDWHNNYRGAPGNDAAWIDRPERGSNRVVRGGSWAYAALDCRAACRYFIEPGFRLGTLGFRLALCLQSVG
jgi:formylglycine-generating enzyme required for sulfatase activity